MFEKGDGRIRSTGYYLPKLEIKYNNVNIDSRHFFDQPINDNTKPYENIRNIATGQGDHYTIGCLLDYFHFRENYKLIATDSSNQKVLKANPRSIQQTNFTGNLDRDGNTISFSLSKKQKELFWIFHEEL